MMSALIKTPLFLFASFLIYFNVLNTNPLHAQNGCEFIQFNTPLVGTCHYRLIVTNSSTCYPFIRLLFFDTGTFENWSVASGWTAEEISPTEILLTHSSGHVPTGASTPFDFYLPPGISPVMDIQWEDSCPPGKSCFTQIQLDPCFIPADACITGVNYVDVGCTQAPYSNQPLLSGRTVTLLDALGNTLQTTTTSATGSYSFCSLPPGNYIVRITNPDGWTPNVPASGQYAVSLEASQTLTRNFGSCRANCLCTSIQTIISPVSAGPNQCCYSLSTQLGGGGQYCFQYIHVQVDAGQSIVPGTAQTGWTMAANGNQEVQITPPGGYIPSNTTMAGTFCVSGSNPHSILTIVGFNDSGGSHECNKVSTFNCYYVDPCPIDKPRIAYTPGPEYSFSGEVDLNPDVSIVSAVWDFGDGTRDSSCCLSNVSHAFEPGTYNACLTITTANDQGETCTDSSCVEVMVIDPCCGGGPNDPDTISTDLISVTPSDVSCSANFYIGVLPDCYFVDSIQWGDGTISLGPFGADTALVHVYENEDTYAVTFDLVQTAPGATEPCFRKSYTRAVNPVCLIACPCIGFGNLILTPGPSGTPLHVQCGNDIVMPCQPGVNYTLTGTMPCACLGWTAPLNWQLYGPNGFVDGGSITTGYPNFSIPLPSGYFSATGTYSLVLNGYCTTACTCVIYFVITQPCPALCPCDIADLIADVAAGFSYTHSFLNCVYCFKGKQLGPCDMVEWKIDNHPYSAPILGTQAYCFNFTTGGQHTIEMRVTRKKGVNSICETFTFIQTIAVNCLPLVVTTPVPIPSKPRQYIPGTGTPPRPLAPSVPAERDRADKAFSDGNTLRIIPNPNTGTFVAEISEPAPANTQYRIVSLTGQSWQTGIIPEGARQQNVEAGELPNGLYFLQLLVNGQVLTVGKLIKQ